MSREAGKHIYDRCERAHAIFGSRIVLSLRRQDTLAASNYRLHAKKGHTVRFEQFLDLEHDNGLWQRKDFEYMRLIQYVEKQIGHKPIVLIFEDYIADPEFYLDLLCAALNCGIDKTKISSNVVHKSYSDKQLRLRRQVADWFADKNSKKEQLKNKTPQGDSVKNFIRYRALLWSSAIFMRFAKLAPESWLSDEPLIRDKRLVQIREFYTEDWLACIEYVNQQARALGVQRNVGA